MRTLISARWLTAALLLALAACERGQEGPTVPDARAPAAGDPMALADPDIPTFEVVSTGTSSSRPGPCVFSATTGQFACPDVTRNGITFTRKFTLYDADGNVQSRYDAATTASIKTETSAQGTMTPADGGSVTIDRSGVMVTSGLAGAETSRTLNGTEQGTVNGEFTGRDGVVVTNETELADTTSNLVVPVPTRDRRAGYPLSGSRVHSTVTTVTRGSDTRTVSVRRKETFDGTSVVQVEITVNGQTRTCTVDLATRTNTCGTGSGR
ncbi:MAG: hypothetical protein HY560_10745 [Gemmatimonadetes bacterium]|nr:hypothetical protein [Gemmatimonadota bacterium]